MYVEKASPMLLVVGISHMCDGRRITMVKVCSHLMREQNQGCFGEMGRCNWGVELRSSL